MIYRKKTHVSLMVYNMNGRQIKTILNENQTVGLNSVNWNAEYLLSGAYFIKLSTEVF